MSSSPDYTPPKVWTWNKANGGQFANIKRLALGNSSCIWPSRLESISLAKKLIPVALAPGGAIG
jgi:hypothetical protein